MIDYLIKHEDWIEKRIQVFPINETVYRATLYEQVNGKWETVIDGTIKWDACSNWEYRDKNHYMHYCGFEEAQHWLDIIQVAYHLVSANMERWDKLLDTYKMPEGYTLTHSLPTMPPDTGPY